MIDDQHREETNVSIHGTSRIEPMESHQTQSKKLRALFPNLPEPQLAEVAETLHGYCAIVWRIYERLQREDPSVIDALMRSRRIKGKVDSS